ncbi:NAD(P)H-dependent oxidoreductase [uncultured Enterococcus sp.]|uniref:NAD(P)H-dependent oxidoreductase n=1 Tax=uncultured Enterococcus sp. TaxID=167972 RepID=UPI002592692B|nr:NAD(P)H-dependent oxidoreductase [uncultured Enterococcus sp.]
MRTLVIVSHPGIQGSGSQQFLKESLPTTSDVTFHHLEACYPDGVIDIRAEQTLLREHDRIIFQFPFYWYSSPPMLKQWQDEVLTESFAFGSHKALAGKSFGLVVVIGNRESEYQAGGREGYSFSSLTLPFQAMANKVGMQFLKPLGIFQFQYMDEAAKQQLLIRYQQYLVLADIDSLKEREEWLMQALAATSLTTLPEGSEFIIQEAIEQISQARMELDELHLYLEGM